MLFKLNNPTYSRILAIFALVLALASFTGCGTGTDAASDTNQNRRRSSESEWARDAQKQLGDNPGLCRHTQEYKSFPSRNCIIATMPVPGVKITNGQRSAGGGSGTLYGEEIFIVSYKTCAGTRIELSRASNGSCRRGAYMP